MLHHRMNLMMKLQHLRMRLHLLLSVESLAETNQTEEPVPPPPPSESQSNDESNDEGSSD